MKPIQNRFCQDGAEAELIAATKKNGEFDDESSLVTAEVTGDDLAEILHGLNNVLAGTLLNAQVMEWKLPSYSRSKRYLHEIERNAQRGGELVRRLLVRLQSGSGPGLSPNYSCSESRTCSQGGLADVPHEVTGSCEAAGIPASHIVNPQAVVESHRKKVPHTIV